MIRILTLSALLAFTVAADAKSNDARSAALVKLLAPWSKQDAPGVQVSVAADGETVFQSATGMANLEQNVPITQNSIFHAASLSKQVTAFAILVLEQEGRLSLDDALARHLPEAAAL